MRVNCLLLRRLDCRVASNGMTAVHAVASKLFWACRCRISHNSLAQFPASPDLQNEFVGAVIGAMESHTDLSTQIFNNPDLSQKLLDELVPIVYKGMKAAR